MEVGPALAGDSSTTRWRGSPAATGNVRSSSTESMQKSFVCTERLPPSLIGKRATQEGRGFSDAIDEHGGHGQTFWQDDLEAYADDWGFQDGEYFDPNEPDGETFYHDRRMMASGSS